KKLTVYGTGYFLGSNLAPNTQANTGSVMINSIALRPGSDNSFIEGLQFTDRLARTSGSRIYFDTVSNIVVSRCLFLPANVNDPYYFYPPASNNLLIKQCFFSNGAGYGLHSIIAMYSILTGFSGMKIENSIFDFQSWGLNGLNFVTNRGNGVVADATFTNNTFLIAMARSDYGNFNFTNNIFVNVGGEQATTAINTLNGTNLNNISPISPFFPVAGNNMQGANIDSLFVGSQPGYHSTDEKWNTRNGSIADGFGQNGVTVGAFGGSNPYKLSGIPNLPFVYSLSVPTQAITPGTLSVRIKAMASN
ncbi:MAG: hypothetical protein JST39_09135, partial [Bacteroidetes bacterium]|nr:hypothetical protein [Bacteroidota bacterium]